MNVYQSSSCATAMLPVTALPLTVRFTGFVVLLFTASRVTTPGAFTVGAAEIFGYTLVPLTVTSPYARRSWM